LGRDYVDKRPFWAGGARKVPSAQDVNLILHKGEILGIVGESGSGKSTVARCILRLIEPSTGSVLMGNDEIATLSGAQLHPVRQRIQIVFHDPGRSLNPRRKIGESVIEGLLNFGESRDNAVAKAVETLRIVELDAD